MSPKDLFKDSARSSSPTIRTTSNKIRASVLMVCPSCCNGTGHDGTGIEPNLKDGVWLYHYFKCGEAFDNIRLLSSHYNLDERADFQEICRRACVDFGITYFAERPTPPPTKVKTPEEIAAEQQKLTFIRVDIANAQANLEHLPENAWLGLTLDTLRKCGCGYYLLEQ